MRNKYEKIISNMERKVITNFESDVFCCESSFDIGKLKRLTFYNSFQCNETLFPTWQKILEQGTETDGSTRKDPKYLTHGIHPYKGKFYPQLVRPLLNILEIPKGGVVFDPFCGSGTFPIEAAMIAANIAPGMNRRFTSLRWTNIINSRLWDDAVEEAEDLINLSVDTDIQGFDIDDNVIKIARSNAANAGVDKLIHFQSRSVAELSHHKKYGFIITNPPYGERLEDKETLPAIYSAFGKQYAKLDSWSAYMITSYDDAEKYFGRKADKNRKIYNGMLKTYFYSFMGPKPPKKG